MSSRAHCKIQTSSFVMSLSSIARYRLRMCSFFHWSPSMLGQLCPSVLLAGCPLKFYFSNSLCFPFFPCPTATYSCANFSVLRRVPTQIAFSNSLCFPCFFPVQWQIFPVPIYVICDYYTHKTDLTDLSSFKICWEIFTANFKIFLPLESGNLQLEQTKFPVFSLYFGKISKFPDKDFFWLFSLFFLFSLCSGYPV